MISTKEKFNKIFLPYIIITAITIVSFNIIYYQNFVIKESNLSESFAALGLPSLYSILFQILITLWFTKNFRTPKNSNPIGIFFFFYFFSLLPTLASIQVAKKMFEPVVTVNNVYSINNSNTHFYKINDFYVDTTKIGETYTFTPESRRYGGKYYSMLVGFAAPIRQINTNSDRYMYWCYDNYSENTKNRNVPPDFFEVYKEQCKVDFIKSTNPKSIKYFERISSKWIKNIHLEAIYDSSQSINKPIIVLVPHYDTIREEIMKLIVYFIAFLLLQIGFGVLITIKSLAKIPQKYSSKTNETP